MLPCRRRFGVPLAAVTLLLAIGLGGPTGEAQSLPEGAGPSGWSTPRSWSVFAEYSPNSTHIMLGLTDQRTFFSLGAGYNLRLAAHSGWQLFYTPEARPVMLESDPVATGFHYDICAPTVGGQPCMPLSGSYRYPQKVPVMNTDVRSTDYSATILGQDYYQRYNFAYGRRWTYAGALSPLAFQASFFPRSRLQPIAGANAGFAVSTRDLPMFDTSAFNFTFGFGAGFQMWRSPGRATQIEYRFQHFSNADIGYNDPGIDSQMIHVSYIWGRR